MTVRIKGTGGSIDQDVTSIDDTDSPHTTSGEDKLFVDTTNGAVTVTLSTADATANPESSLLIVDAGENAGTNNITVNTEGSEVIDPGDAASKTIDVDGGWLAAEADGSNWFAFAAVADLEVGSFTDGSANTITDFVGDGLTTASNVLQASLGDGLDFASGAIQILDSIWDGTNLVADVDNTTTTTTEVNNDDYHEAVTTGNVSGTTGLDLSASNYFSHTLTGNTTFEFNNANADPAGNSFYLEVTQDGTGGHTITWPGSVEWPFGNAPSLGTSANDTHALTFTTHDGGTTWRGTVRGEEFA